MVAMKIHPTRMTIWITAALAAVILFALAAVLVALPAYMQSRLIPQAAHALGLEPETVQVRRIGLWGADVGPIRLRSGGSTVFSIGALLIDYSPASLLGGGIQGITLVAPRIELSAAAGKIAIPGLSLPANDEKNDKATSPPDLKTLIPLGIQWIRIEQAEVAIRTDRQRLPVMLDADIDTRHLNQGRLSGQVQLSIMGNRVSLDAAISQPDNLARLVINSTGFRLQTLDQAGLLPESAQIHGMADLAGECRFSIDPPAVRNFSLTAGLQDTRVRIHSTRIENPHGDNSGRPPIIVAIQGDDPALIQWSCTSFEVTEPAKLGIAQLSGVWRQLPTGWSMKADMRALLAAQTVMQEIELKNEIPVDSQVEALRAADGRLSVTAGVAAGGELSLATEQAAISAVNVRMNIEGRLDTGTLGVKSKLAADSLHIESPALAVSIPKPTINGTITLAPPDDGEASTFSARAVLSDIRSGTGAANLNLPQLEINASGRQITGTAPWHFTANLKTAQAVIKDPGRKWAASGVSLDMPLAWPPPDKGQTGRLEIRGIQWNSRRLGGIKGTVKQRAHGVDMDLRHDSRLFPGLIVLMTGGTNNNDAQLEARIPAYELDESANLSRFFPAAAGMLVKGRLTADIQAGIRGGALYGKGHLLLENAGLRQEARQLSLDGIRLELHMDDLISLKSAPRQSLQIGQLQSGKLAARALDVNFQLERGQTLFVEKAAVNWCNGRINTSTVRIAPGVDDYDVTLFCDRLNLAMVLDQLGAAEASGEGTVNGRLPVRWADGKLSFDNGFLYSTPGQAGAIQLSGTEVLLSGVPAGTPQHTQLDIATEALKDYTYQWAKLNVSSDGDNLLLALKFDGKPNRLLPFAYDQSLGQFKRVGGSGQADFKGISIDLNFTSPLNDIIHYKDLLRQK